jgi:hypothetical protein
MAEKSSFSEGANKKVKYRFRWVRPGSYTFEVDLTQRISGDRGRNDSPKKETQDPNQLVLLSSTIDSVYCAKYRSTSTPSHFMWLWIQVCDQDTCLIQPVYTAGQCCQPDTESCEL